MTVAPSPHPASTVLLLRDGPSAFEVFLLQRRKGSRFVGAHVFPGGRVDSNDRLRHESRCDGIDHATRQLPDLPAEDAVAYHVAAVRELFEEASVLLARTASGRFVDWNAPSDRPRFEQFRQDLHAGRVNFQHLLRAEDLRLALDALVLHARWVTPLVETARFDTCFFAARVPPAQTPIPDAIEASHGAWMTPAAAIAAAVRRAIVLPPPTWVTLRELERFVSSGDVLESARARRIPRRQPRLLEQEGTRMLLMPGDPLHPGDDGGAVAAAGETRFVWMEDEWRPLS
jgi:8-oxo-dGTP pyrophosphatase MutT (NUDIX family)